MAGPGGAPGEDAMPRFCNADTVPAETATAVERWARERLRHPPPERMHQAIEITITENLGMHALARCSYRTGDLVLSEAALMRVPEMSRDMRSRLERRFGDRSPFLAPAVAVDWSAVSEDERTAALSLFWAHPLMTKPSSPLVRENRQVCSEVKDFHEPLKDWDPKDLMKFLHVVDLNLHKDDENTGHSSFNGIFVLGSKFSHSCAPNCSWGFDGEGNLEYHAIRPIQAGDLLTFSYVGNGMNLITSTTDRRARLGALWFVCQCDRCCGEDQVRRMRCPRCKASECLPIYPQGRVEWSGDCPLKDLIPDAAKWRCAACSGTSPAAEMPLREEDELSNLVPRAMQGPPERASQDAATLAQLRARAAKTVGVNHWTYILASFALLQKSLAQLRSEPVFDRSEAELRDASTRVAKWMRESVRESSEQRLSALFITVRLAHNLGGRLEGWGYDAGDPLGDGLFSAERLEGHGWRASEDGVRSADEEDGPSIAGRSGMSKASGDPSLASRPRFTGVWR